MKKILLLFAVVLQLFAQDGSTPLLIGAGPYIQTQPYKGADAKIVPSPVVFFDNQRFYVRWTRVGVYLAGSATDDFSWGISLTAEPQPLGYQSSDAPILHSLSSKDTSIQAGLGLDMEYKKYFLSAVAMQDILNRSNSYIMRAEVGKHIEFGKFDFYPSVLATYHSGAFNNYYYGVTQNEATSTLLPYNAGSSVDLGTEAYLKYNFTNKWSTLINARVDYLGASEQNSPLVSQSTMISGLISLLYKLDI